MLQRCVSDRHAVSDCPWDSPWDTALHVRRKWRKQHACADSVEVLAPWKTMQNAFKGMKGLTKHFRRRYYLCWHQLGNLHAMGIYRPCT